jgi:CDP-glucose 4,6-dehydratase
VEGLVGFRDRSVLVTGHTGFKGSWLCLWLERLGARVHGYALAPPTQPNLFEAAKVTQTLASDVRADLGDLPQLTATMERTQPEIVFHVAAQSLVSEGYRDPLGTIATNVIGTTNLLEAVRAVDSVQAVVVVATDKVYENNETGVPFVEGDSLGGSDPYSGSKAAAEVIVATYRTSYFGAGTHRARIASARAGNVIGGGDWAPNRLVPDCIRAFAAGVPVRVRHPDAVRPWQHVLGPLSGYLMLADCLLGGNGHEYARAWNFGPDARDDASVGAIAEQLAEMWGSGARVELAAERSWHDAALLRLNSANAREALGWRPAWPLQKALERTVAWHKAWLIGEDMRRACDEQIAEYVEASAQ